MCPAGTLALCHLQLWRDFFTACFSPESQLWWAGVQLIPVHIRNPRLYQLHTPTATCVWKAQNTDKGAQEEDGTGSIPKVIAMTQNPYKNKSEQIVPLYPESFVPSSGVWLSLSLADRAPRPSYACALLLYLLSWTSILPLRFTGQIERGEKTNHS